MWFGHVNKCAHWKNAKHMFLWGLIVLLKEFPKTKRINLEDDTKIKCKNGGIYHLAKYYFLRYGKLYYQLYFDFNIYFYLQKSRIQYDESLIKRNSAKITKKWITETLQELNVNIPEFINIFGKNHEMNIGDYLNYFTIELRKKYCDIFYIIVGEFYDQFIINPLPTTFYININNKEEILEYLQIKLHNL